MAATRDDLGTATDEKRGLAPAQLALIIGGLLLLLLLVWFLFLRSDGEEIETGAAPAPVEEVTEEEEEAEVESPDKKSPVETFEVFAPKDPFDPLVSPATAGAGNVGQTAGGTTATAANGSTTTTGGSGTTTTTDGTGTTTTSASGGGGSDVGGHRVRVIDVYQQAGGARAQIQVDGTVYTVDEGERFAENFQLMSTSGHCATMLYGDDEFTLCEGEEILK